MSTIIRVLIVLVCAYAVRWSQALNFQTFPTLIKQRRNSDPKKPIFRFKKREHVADRAGRHVDAARRPLPPGHRTRRSASPPVDTVVHVPGIPDRSFIEVQKNILSRIALSRGFDWSFGRNAW
jgi:hypothetical protein